MTKISMYIKFLAQLGKWLEKAGAWVGEQEDKVIAHAWNSRNPVITHK